ncbi:MAG TPA: hypothetical protein PKV03_06205 [Methylotenera sp.]|nr:hypothetical protein [Methylotenera sp.]
MKLQKMATRQRLQIIFLPSENRPCTKVAMPIIAKMVRDQLFPETAFIKQDNLDELNVQFNSACTHAQHLLKTKST